MRLLLVEDDPMIGKGVQQGLLQDGFSVDWVMDGRPAERALGNAVYDLMLLDLGLPTTDGSKVLRNLRARGNLIPVLIGSRKSLAFDPQPGAGVAAVHVDPDRIGGRSRNLSDGSG